MRVLVMGGTQFNGLALVHRLVEAGHDVTVCNRGRSEATLPDGVSRLTADRTDHDRVREVLGGTEWDCVQDMTAYHPSDVELMVELLRDRVGHYVFASSTVTYAPSDLLPIDESFPDDRGPHQIEYGMHKLLCEDLLVDAHREHGFPATTVAFSMVFGPHNALHDREQRMFARLLERRPVLVPGSGTTVTQHGHVDDQADALEQMMGVEATFGRRYNLTGRALVTDIGYVRTVAEAVGVEPEIVHVPNTLMDDLWDARVELTNRAQAERSMDSRPTGDVVPEDPHLLIRRFEVQTVTIQRLAPNLHRWDRNVIFDIDRLRRDIGFAPRHDFASMVADTYEWYRREGAQRGYDWALEDEIIAMCR